MRFAWLKENSPNDNLVKQASMHPLAIIRKIYNLAFWIFLLPFFTIVDYGTGFIIFTAIIGIRLVLNVFTNNLLDLTPQQFENYPFRIPSGA
jgi:hypothetical protein